MNGDKVRARILRGALDVVSVHRDEQYGDPYRNFQRIGELWSTFLETDVPIRPHEVAAMLCMVKLSRIANSPDHEDSWVDLAGYAALGAECAVNAEAPDPTA